MPTVFAHVADPLEVDTDLLVAGVFKGGIEGPGVTAILEALQLDGVPVTPAFRGDIGEHLMVAAPGLAARGVLFVGLGRMDATDHERLRRAAGVAARAATKIRRVATTLALVHASETSVEAIAEGFLLGAYADQRFKSETKREGPRLKEVVVLVPSGLRSAAQRAIERAERYVHATCRARDLVNTPPDRKRPPDLAETVRALIPSGGATTVHVRDEQDLAREGFGGLLGVGRGSAAPPRLVEIRYRPEHALGHVALVGKGITFDSGGLSLKRGSGMDEMKSDMAGAATVAAVCSVLDELDVRMEVTGLLPLAENLPGDDAQRPQDVLTIYDGTTVEVLDTDAEGRLVLADALAYAATLTPDAIVDLATLTGTVIGALGAYAAGIMSTDDELLDSLRRAAAIAGEPLWPLPLWPDLEHFLDSGVADLNNTGDGPGAGAIMGGLFLRRFTGDLPWAHLDIAGPAFLSKTLARDYLPVGGTGYGVRTLLAWLERRGR